MSGGFITFEGVEGCGKSTQIELLRRHIEARGCPVVVSREPGGTTISEAVRGILLDPANHAMAVETELLLYAAARAQHVRELIIPALEAGKVVLCDRFIDSTVAYQGAGRDIPPATVATLNVIATAGRLPDLTILLDVPAEEGLARARERGRYDRLEQESVAFHDAVRQGYLQLARQEPGRIRIVDGTQSIEQVADIVRQLADGVLESA